MDTKKLVADMKARFEYNSAKHYLKEKYSSKLFVAEQGGYWKADVSTISFLNATTSKTVVLLDLYDIPVSVNVKKLKEKLATVYDTVMTEWYEEYKELESKR